MVKNIILICSDFEWSAVKQVTNPKEILPSPFGEYFVHSVRGSEYLFFQTGWTKTVASAGAQYVIDTYKPEFLINLGTCGGFHGTVSVGDILLAQKTIMYDVHELMGDHEETINKFTTELDTSWVPNDIKESTKLAIIASADRDVAPGSIDLLKEKFGAHGADWESASIAYVSKINKQKVLILRGVTDVVSSASGEAYNNETLFEDRCIAVFKKLFNLLRWI